MIKLKPKGAGVDGNVYKRIKVIEKAITKLLNCANKHSVQPHDRCYQFCETILKNINICKDSKWEDIDALSQYIQEDWSEMKASKTKAWQQEITGTEPNIKLFGINPFEYEWVSEFIAVETANGVWEFYTYKF